MNTGRFEFPDTTGETFIKENLETWLNSPDGPAILEEWGIHTNGALLN